MSHPDVDVSAAFFAAIANLNVDEAFALVSPTVTVDIHPADIREAGVAEGRAFFDELVAAFPDLELRPSRVLAMADGTIVTELVFEGTQARDFLGVINQEKHLDIEQAWLVGVSDNLITSIRAYWCQNQLYRRLAVKRLDQVALV